MMPIDVATLPHDLSPWRMFLAADIVVKAVLIMLVAASVATWSILLAKTLELRAARRRSNAILSALLAIKSLGEAVAFLAKHRISEGVALQLVNAAVAEMALSEDARGEGLKERIASHLERIEASARQHIMQGTGMLASIGSTAPFVGLFGTVWGIMNSFVDISKAHTTNLAVVAPGIAEALLATAFGLAAAIPAVLIYNMFSRSITGYRGLIADISAAIFRIASRDIDREHAVQLLKKAG